MAKRRKHKKRQEEYHEEHETAQEATVAGNALSPAALYKRYERPILISLTVLLILIPLFLSITFRSYSVDVKAVDGWAQSSVYQNIRSGLGQQFAKQYPNLPQQNRDQLVEKEFTKFLDQNSGQVEQQIESTAAMLRAQLKDEDGQTYLIAIDPYFYLRHVENMIKSGHPGDELRDGKPYDTHMLAPIGTFTGEDFHTWVGYRLYQLFSPLSGKSPMAIFFWVPVLFAALAVIPAFFLGRKKGGLLGGFFAATIIAVHAGFIGRTPAGFSDTDAYVVLFPLLCGWLLLEAFESDSWKEQSLYLGLTGLFFGLFAWAWDTWWYFFDVFLLALFAYGVYSFVRHLVRERPFAAYFSTKEFKGLLITIGGLIAATAIFVSLFKSPQAIISGPLSAVQRTIGIKAAVKVGNIWPNVYTTVAELNAPSIKAIISNIGGSLLFVLALMGVLLSLVGKKRLLIKDWLLLGVGFITFFFLVNKGTSMSIIQFLVIMSLPVLLGFILLLKDEREIDIKYAIFLIVWLMASVFTMTKGVRFVLLLIPPFALSAAVAVSIAFNLLKEWLVKDVKFDTLWVAPVLFILFSLLLIPPIVDGHTTGMQEVPSMSDAWWNSLTKIKEESQPDAIINSWWDFGHWFKYVADRAVTFDGASQNTPMAHWIGRALITSDEKETLAILRMLDCGSFLGVEDVQAGLSSNDSYEAIMLTKEIIMLPPAEAEARLLKAGINPAQTETILNHTHCEPPEDYFITSGDMVGKAGVWGHFGSWDFAKADAYTTMRKLSQPEAVPLMTAKYNWSEKEADDVYYQMETLSNQDKVNAWISPWPGYAMSSWRDCHYDQNGTIATCSVNAKIAQQQSTQIMLEGLLLNLSDFNASRLSFGFYDSSGRKVGQNDDITPSILIIVENGTMTRYDLGGDGFGQALIVDLDNGPRLLMADPANAESIFTRLFFLDGETTSAFEKFSDERAFNLGRIIVWKVDWSKLQEFGLE